MQTLHVRSQELANRQIIQLFYILGGAGFFPSTVSTSDYSGQTDLFHQQYQCFVAKQKCEIPSILARSKAPRSVALTNRWQATTSNPVNNKPSHCISLFKKKQTCFPPKKKHSKAWMSSLTSPGITRIWHFCFPRNGKCPLSKNRHWSCQVPFIKLDGCTSLPTPTVTIHLNKL